MKTRNCRGVLGALVGVCALWPAPARADVAVVPSSGNGVELAQSNQGTIGGEGVRRFMMVIDPQSLTGMPLGSTITGFRVRLNNNNTSAWPPSPVTIADYEMRISAAATTSGTVSTTFADNISGVQTLVMDGSLSIAQNTYGAGATGTTPEAFGPVIPFDRGFLYLGGSLCIDINYSGTGLVNTVFMDGPGVGDGMGSVFSAASRTAVTGGTANGNVLAFEYTPPRNTIVPSSLAAEEGSSGQEGPMGGITNRRYQYVVDEATLGIPPGATILGMAFRLDQAGTVAAWPPTTFAFADYEVRLSQGVSTGAMTTTYADNIIGSQTLVANGAMTVNPGAFQDEKAPPTPEQFGRVVMFSTPYVYLGGNLCIDINHPGTGLGATDFVDGTAAADFATYGMRGLYSSVSRTALTGGLTSAPVTRFIYSADLRQGVTKVYGPEVFASAEAPGQLNSLLNAGPRSVMTVSSADQFATIAPGSRVVGHSGRLSSGSVAWPGAGALYQSYRIDVSRSVNPPGALSTTFANNVGTDAVTTYNDSLTIPVNAFRSTGASNEPFSHTFFYKNAYAYTGGALNTFVRHSGNSAGSDAFLDAVRQADPEFGTAIDCLFSSSSAAATGSAISATVLRHEVDAATTVPLNLGAPAAAFVVSLMRFDEYSYQVVVGAEQLRYIPVGSLIDSMWVRNWSGGPASPSSDSICPDFEMTVSKSANSPATMSTLYASNEGADAVMVHDGPLGVKAGSIPAGTTGVFGRAVKFQRAYVYKGGDLCVTVRHRKFTQDVCQCESRSSTLPGARSLYAESFLAIGGAYLGGEGSGGIAVTRFGYVPSVMTPNAFAAVEANDGFQFFSQPSTVQMIIPASQLLPVDVGSAITGMSLRNSATGLAPTSPEFAQTASRFDVTLAPAARTTLTMSDTFATNIGPGVVTVREGPLVVPAGAFPASGNVSIAGENEWFIDFDRAFIYEGGDLCLTIRSTLALTGGVYMDTETGGSALLGATRWNQGDANALISSGTTGPVAVRLAFTARAFCPWDLNNDGVVDDGDFPIFLNAYNILDCADGSMPFGCPADFDRNGVVDDLDFQLFVVAYNALLCP